MGLPLLAVLLAVLLAAPSCSRSAGKPSPLHVEGTALLDERGDTVVLKGLSFGWHNLWPRFYNRGAVRHIHKEWGCNLFRFSIGVDDLLEKGTVHKGYISDPALGWKCVTAGVDAALSCGAYAIIDWHSHKLHQKEAVAFFDALSKLYADEPGVIYELYNEPVDDSWKDLKSYAQVLVKTIRANAPDALILMGCPHWDQDIDLPAADPIKDAGNLMYTVHFYAATHGEYLRTRTEKAMGKGLPVFISECAGMEASGDGPLDYESWGRWLEWSERNKVSMVMWSLSDKDETCSMLFPKAGSRGPWDDSVIKEWGLYVKQLLRDSSRKDR